MMKNQKGMSVIEVLLVTTLVTLVCFVSWYVWEANKNTSVLHQSKPTVPPTKLVILSNSDNGKVIDTAVNESIVVRLDTIDWTFGTNTNSDIIRQSPQKVTQGSVSCRAQADCGNVSIHATAIAKGRITMQATRQKCGELMLCMGNSGVFNVTLNVQ